MSENPLIQKFSKFFDMTHGERAAIERWCAFPVKISARRPFIVEGDRPDEVCLFLRGWGYRYSDISNGKRQIVGFLLPGDMCDARAFILSAADHSIGMLTEALISAVPRKMVIDTTNEFPRLAQALWWSTLVDEGIARRWIVNIGQRDATERMAHLFCELWIRAKTVGLITNDYLTVPMTQQDLGEALGVTGVHVNRTLKALKQKNLIRLRGRNLSVDFTGLQHFADFDPTYLQLERRT